MRNIQRSIVFSPFVLTGIILWILYILLESTESDLTNYGALIIGLISSTIVAAIIWLSQIIQSERLDKQYRNIAEKIYARPISHYAITMKYYEKDNDVIATENTLKYFQNLVDSLVLQGKSIKDIEISGKGKAKEIELDKGVVRITIPEIMESSRPQKTCTRSIKLYLQTESYRILDKIITENQLVYHNLEWHIADPYPVESMMNKIKNNEDLPECVFEDISADDLSRATIHKTIKLNTIKIYAVIYQHDVNLICSYERSKHGFYRAHQLFAPAEIISILFDEIVDKDVKKLLKKAMRSKAD